MQNLLQSTLEAMFPSNSSSTSTSKSSFFISNIGDNPIKLMRNRMNLLTIEQQPTYSNPFENLQLVQQPPWPITILFNSNSMLKYNRLFVHLIQIKQIEWKLGLILTDLKSLNRVQTGPSIPTSVDQMHHIHLWLYDFYQFGRNLGLHFTNHVIKSNWVSLIRKLGLFGDDHPLLSTVPNNTVGSLDELCKVHRDYLNDICHG